MLKNLKLSAKNITTTRGITLSGILLALYVVLSLFTIPLTPDNRIVLTFIATAAAGYTLGPVPAMLVGGMGDVLGYFLNPNGAYFFGFTLSAMLNGLICGVCFYRKKFKYIFLWILLSRILMTFGVNIILNTLWLSILYDKAANFFAIPRIIKNLAAMPVQLVITFVMLTAIERFGLKNKFCK